MSVTQVQVQVVLLYGPPGVGKYTVAVELAARTGFRLEPVHVGGGSVLFVQLTCEREELFRRVGQEDRRRLDKLVDTGRLRELLQHFDLLSPAPFGQHLSLDITHVVPSDAATAVINHYAIAAA